MGDPHRNTNDNVVKVLIGNKLDMEENRKVSYAEGLELGTWGFTQDRSSGYLFSRLRPRIVSTLVSYSMTSQAG